MLRRLIRVRISTRWLRDCVHKQVNMNIRLSFSSACAFSLLTSLTGLAPKPLIEIEHHALSWSQEECPQISVSCPSSFEPGEAIKFKEDIVGGNPNVVPSYSWTVSRGRIIEGQGTAAIKIDTLGFGKNFTATVRVTGFDPSCSVTASCSNMIDHNAPPAVLFDRYYPKANARAVPKKVRTKRRTIRRH